MKKSIIIVAGGKGVRMGKDIPKQFIEINGKPIIFHTIEKFFNYDNQMEIILVLPKEHIEFFKELYNKLNCSISVKTVIGGSERFHSVSNGLKEINHDGLVGIHDGVRPFVSVETINNCYSAALEKGNAIPIIEPNESIRQLNNKGSEIIDRSTIRLVQTPQVFKVDEIKQAYKQEFSPKFTDDASVLEAIGKKIELVEGNIENIKITRAFDLIIARAILES